MPYAHYPSAGLFLQDKRCRRPRESPRNSPQREFKNSRAGVPATTIAWFYEGKCGVRAFLTRQLVSLPAHATVSAVSLVSPPCGESSNYSLFAPLERETTRPRGEQNRERERVFATPVTSRFEIRPPGRAGQDPTAA